jgi:hypothetical protein
MFDNPRNVKRLLTIFFSSVIILLIIDVIYIFLSNKHVIERHVSYRWEEYFGFYAIFGFVACVILVLVSKYILRPLVKREEDYYDK